MISNHNGDYIPLYHRTIHLPYRKSVWHDTVKLAICPVRIGRFFLPGWVAEDKLQRK